jgi:uncharacterized tannase-like protein DUF6351
MRTRLAVPALGVLCALAGAPAALAAAVADGTYGPWIPGAADVTRLQQIFPTGVCDYSKPDVGRPSGF